MSESLECPSEHSMGELQDLSLWNGLLGHNIMMNGPQGVRTHELSRAATRLWSNQGQGQGSGYPHKDKTQYRLVLGEAAQPPDPPNIAVTFISEFPSRNKDFPGSFPGSSVSVHFITVYNQIQRCGSLGQGLLSFPLSCFLTFFILCLLWQVVGIQNARHWTPLLRCAQPAPDIQTDTQTWLKC